MKQRLIDAIKENRSFLVFVVLMFVFRSAVADWNDVPTSSMKPTIIEGDRIFVNKMAYDLRVPFTHISLLKLSDPARGDIIVFDSNVSDKRLVKRVIGVPGDVVEMTDNRLTINGQLLTYAVDASTDLSVDKTEDLLGITHSVRMKKAGGHLSNFSAVEVPAGYYLALGDNRDNSADSRVIGFIPRDEIVGRSRSVVMSLNYENYYIPRSDRFFHTL